MCKNKGGQISPVLVDWGVRWREGEGALFCLLLYCQFRIACLEAALERLTPSSFCHKWHHVMSLMSKGFKIATMLSPQYVISEEKRRSIWAFFFLCWFIVCIIWVSFVFSSFYVFLRPSWAHLGSKFCLVFCFCLKTCWSCCAHLWVSQASLETMLLSWKVIG